MTTSETAGQYALTVDRKEFVKALKDIARFRRRRAGFVRFGYRDGDLSIAMPDVTIRVTAQGNWPTEVTMAGEWVKRMARVPPPDDPVTVTYDGSQVRIGTMVIPAVRAQ